MIKVFVAGYSPKNAIWGFHQGGYEHYTFEPAASDAIRKTEEQGIAYKVYSVTLREETISDD